MADSLMGDGENNADVSGGGRVDVPPELVALAESVDGVATGGGVAAVSAMPSLASEFEGLASLLVAMISPAYPWVARVWAPDVLGRVSIAAEAVCNKHGWLQDGIAAGPEVMFALSIAAPVLATIEQVRESAKSAKEAANGSQSFSYRCG